MAFSSIIYAVLFSLLPALVISTSHNYHPIKHGLRSMHFTLYQHDTVNKTDFMIVNGLGGPAFTASTTPFGSILALKDPLTATRDPASKRLGTLESVGVAYTPDGLHAIGVTKITLNLKGLKGSISLSGVTDYLTASDYPVAGGTGDFLFVQGYVTSIPILFQNPYSLYKNVFHLYWPPYAHPRIKQ